MLIFGRKNCYYFYLFKSIHKYPGLIKKKVLFTQKSLSGIKYSDKSLLKLGGSKHQIFLALDHEIVSSVCELL